MASLVGQGLQAPCTAYALDAVLDELLFVIGPLLAGLGHLYQPAAGVLATAGLAVAGTLGVVASPVSRAQTGSRAAAAASGRAAGAPARPRTLVLSLAGVGAAIGIWEIGLVGAAREHGCPRPPPCCSPSGRRPAASAASGTARTPRRSAGHRYLALLTLLVLAGTLMSAAGSPSPSGPWWR